MTYKYVSVGLNLGHVSGKVTWYHDSCAIQFQSLGAGGQPKKTEEKPPKDTKCYWCGKLMEQEQK